MPQPTPCFDVAIVGPGPVGAAAALAMAQKGFRVALIGPSSARRDGRTVALMDGSWRLLAGFGVTKRLKDEAAPLATMRLVDDTGSLFRRPPTEFKAHEIGLDQFGWNVETAILSAALLEAIAAEPAITRLDGVLSSMNADGHMAHLTLAQSWSPEPMVAVRWCVRRWASVASIGSIRRRPSPPSSGTAARIGMSRPSFTPGPGRAPRSPSPDAAQALSGW
jgi:2-polyprenyl-6-methoxyphenol hydroxylase-like FAD-dependent oxidoreductase